MSPRAPEDEVEEFDANDDAFGDDEGVDSGPSEEDRRRFSREHARCPECGAEVWDDASLCPACGALLDGGASRFGPVDAWWRQRWIVLVVVVLVLAMAGLLPLLLRLG